MGTDIYGQAQVWQEGEFRVAEDRFLGNPRCYLTFAMLGGPRGPDDLEEILVRDAGTGEPVRSRDLQNVESRCVLLADLRRYIDEVASVRTCEVVGLCPVAEYRAAVRDGKEPPIYRGGTGKGGRVADEADLGSCPEATHVLLQRVRRYVDCSFLLRLRDALEKVAAQHGVGPDQVRYLYWFD